MSRELDELNQLNQDELMVESGISYEEYFGGMELSDEEKKKRIELAEQFEELFLYFLVAYAKNREFNYEELMREKYTGIAIAFLHQKSTPAYIGDHAKQLAKEVVQVTTEHEGEEFYTSKERGMLISANEANVVGNYGQQVQAIKEGKKYKTWITESDEKVRHTHREVDRKKIGIFEPFEVGGSLMLYPKDQTYSPSASETANCRCIVKYS